MRNKIQIFETENGKIELNVDLEKETVWMSLNQMSDLFGRDKSVISRHIKNIFLSGELREEGVVAKIATTASDGKTYKVDFYNLDMIISVGYKVDSKKATSFRIWATDVLKNYITKGYSINQKRIKENYDDFLKTVESIKLLTKGKDIKAEDIMELIKSFGNTWFNLESYDKDELPKTGDTKKDLKITASELYEDVKVLKKELMEKKEATQMFAQEKNKGSLEGILGNVFQTAFGEEVYPSIEEKAANLLYFIIKNHPFNDGNKRTGAFSFVWFLNKANYDFKVKITPETLTAITLLIAESNPNDKEKMIGLVILLLR